MKGHLPEIMEKQDHIDSDCRERIEKLRAKEGTTESHRSVIPDREPNGIHEGECSEGHGSLSSELNEWVVA